MAPIRSSEHEVAHIASMIAMLQRMLECQINPSTHCVFQPAYWRARLESVVSRVDTQGPVAAQASALLAKLDAMDSKPLPRGEERP
jgi:hypothetical protein